MVFEVVAPTKPVRNELAIGSFEERPNRPLRGRAEADQVSSATHRPQLDDGARVAGRACAADRAALETTDESFAAGESCLEVELAARARLGTAAEARCPVARRAFSGEVFAVCAAAEHAAAIVADD